MRFRSYAGERETDRDGTEHRPDRATPGTTGAASGQRRGNRLFPSDAARRGYALATARRAGRGEFVAPVVLTTLSWSFTATESTAGLALSYRE